MTQKSLKDVVTIVSPLSPFYTGGGRQGVIDPVRSPSPLFPHRESISEDEKPCPKTGVTHSLEVEMVRTKETLEGPTPIDTAGSPLIVFTGSGNLLDPPHIPLDDRVKRS